MCGYHAMSRLRADPGLPLPGELSDTAAAPLDGAVAVFVWRPRTAGPAAASLQSERSGRCGFGGSAGRSRDARSKPPRSWVSHQRVNFDPAEGALFSRVAVRDVPRERVVISPTPPRPRNRSLFAPPLRRLQER